MIHDDFVIFMLLILYPIIGGFMVFDAWFDFKLSGCIRKHFVRICKHFGLKR